jgi:hypothetical protein
LALDQRSLLAPVERDVFVAESVNGARDIGDKVIFLTLKQRGQVLQGEREAAATQASIKSSSQIAKLTI